MSIKAYYDLAKPGIIYGNALTAAAGFFLATTIHFHLVLFISMLFGLSFVIGSGCVCNNIVDYDIDAEMSRTKGRAMVTGSITKKNAIIYAIALLIIGGVLLYYTSFISLIVSLVGFIVYVFVYTPLKRHTYHSTLIGSIAGAVPPVVGYTAVSNHIDLAAWLLFLIVTFWQMPHFYAIAIRRYKEYAQASVPVLPIQKGILTTKIHMVVYIVGFGICGLLLYGYRYVGHTYLIIFSVLSLVWLVFAIQGFKKHIDDTKWAKKMFLYSLIVITIFSVIVSLPVVMR